MATSNRPSDWLVLSVDASAPSTMPVRNAVGTSPKSITTGLAPNDAKISVSRPGGERNFQSSRSPKLASGRVELSDS